jgi:peptide-methionine (S)-S-oxide reductase
MVLFYSVADCRHQVDGVISAVSGYSGGARDTAHYEMTSSGTTGHAESEHRISYGRILQIYFSVAHDPTELNRQGPDSGTQYRSAIVPQTPEQVRIATAYIAQLNQAKVFASAIVTTIEPDKAFYPAEAYHQDYLTLHPNQPYIAIKCWSRRRSGRGERCGDKTARIRSPVAGIDPDPRWRRARYVVGADDLR